MCNLRSRFRLSPLLLFLGLAVLLILPQRTRAQATRPTREMAEEVGAQIESMAPLLQRLAARKDAAEAAARLRRIEKRGLVLDTFRVGPFQVAAEPHQRALAREVMEDTWADYRPLAEGSEALIEPYLWVVHRSWERSRPDLLGDSIRWVRVHARVPESRLWPAAASEVRAVLAQGIPHETGSWAAGFPSLASALDPWAARELVSAPSHAARECFRGNLSWCWEAVGLADSVGALSRWYTPEERRQLVRQRGASFGGEREVALWNGCADQGLQEACDFFLGRRPVMELIPLGQNSRTSLLGYALRVGGDGAFERFRARAPESLKGALLDAAGVPADSLMAGWRRQVLAARPNAWAGLVRTPLSVLAWILLMAALATRSTRWRLG